MIDDVTTTTAGGDILIGCASHALTHGTSAQALNDYADDFPTIEFSAPIAQLPEMDFVARVAEIEDLSPVWRITIDDMADAREYFAGQAWGYFIQALDPEWCTLILALERSCEYESKDVEFLQALIEELFPLPCFLEFEHHSWKRAARVLQAAKIPIVQHDAPELPGIIKDIPFEGKRACLRLLGRDKRTWFAHTPSERFVYIYNEAELAEITDRVQALQRIAKIVVVIFANHPGEAGMENGRWVKRKCSSGPLGHERMRRPRKRRRKLLVT